MHIAIDGKRYFHNSSGLGRYSRNLVNSLLSLEHKEEFFITLFRPKGRVKFDAPSYPQLKLITAKYFLPGDIGNGFWRFVKLPGLINAKRYSLFHGPSHVLPRRVKCPTIVTMFDLIFLRFPRYFPMWDRNYYKIMFKKSAHMADHIISISEATKADLINFFGVDEDKVSVVYPALDDLFSPLVEPQLEEVKEKEDKRVLVSLENVIEEGESFIKNEGYLGFALINGKPEEVEHIKGRIKQAGDGKICTEGKEQASASNNRGNF